MLNSLISHFAPHYCLSCGEIGQQICESCYFDIELSARQKCFVCHKFLLNQRYTSCSALRDVTQVILAEREGVLARLVDEYKFSSARGAEVIIARLFHDNTPLLPLKTHLVPVPTASSHIRQRGFDHTRDISRQLARIRGVVLAPIVERRHNAVQVGASFVQRQQQAASAYRLKTRASIDPDAVYVVCDDIVTTGASMAAMVALLRSHGATQVVCLALLQQPWQE